MFLFYLTNLLFLGSFVWLSMTGAGLLAWGVWIALWLASDYAVMWITGYVPPNWVWTAILAVLAALWGGLAMMYGG